MCPTPPQKSHGQVWRRVRYDHGFERLFAHCAMLGAPKGRFEAKKKPCGCRQVHVVGFATRKVWVTCLIIDWPSFSCGFPVSIWSVRLSCSVFSSTKCNNGIKDVRQPVRKRMEVKIQRMFDKDPYILTFRVLNSHDFASFALKQLCLKCWVNNMQFLQRTTIRIETSSLLSWRCIQIVCPFSVDVPGKDPDPRTQPPCALVFEKSFILYILYALYMHILIIFMIYDDICICKYLYIYYIHICRLLVMIPRKRKMALMMMMMMMMIMYFAGFGVLFCSSRVTARRCNKDTNMIWFHSRSSDQFLWLPCLAKQMTKNLPKIHWLKNTFQCSCNLSIC